ncbi:hypothetical protein ACHHYP_05742, partial [Achlya hypogyna]
LAQESAQVLIFRKARISTYTNPKPIKLCTKAATLFYSNGRVKLGEYLSQYSFFAQERLVELCRLKTFQPQEQLITPDSAWHDIIIVLTGQLGLYFIEGSTTTATTNPTDSQRKASSSSSSNQRLVATVTAGECYGHLHLWRDAGRRVDDATHHWLLQRPFTSTLVACDASDIVLLDRRDIGAALISSALNREIAELASIPHHERRPQDVADLHRWCIRHSFAFQQLPDATMDRIAEHVSVMQIDAHKLVYNTASDADAVYFIADGGVSLSAHVGHPPITLLPGDFFGHDDMVARHRRAYVASTTEPTTLLKLSKATYMAWLHPIALDVSWQPASLLAQTPLGRGATRENVQTMGLLLENLKLLAHVPQCICLELVPYLTVREVAEGDTLCAEDIDADAFFATVVRGRLGAYSRDHVEACQDALEHHPLCYALSVDSPRALTDTEKQLGLLHGHHVHTFEPGDTMHSCGDGDVAPMTLVAVETTLVFVLLGHDVTAVLQRLAEPTKPAWTLRTCVDTVVIDEPGDIAALCQELWYVGKTVPIVADVLAFAPGDKLVHAGDRLECLYLILNGTASVTKLHRKAALHPVAPPPTAAAAAPMRDLTSNFKTTTKTLMGSRHEKRSKSVLPTIMKLSKRMPRLRLNSIAPEESSSPPPMITATILDKNYGRRRDCDTEREASLHMCWTLKPGDVYGGEIAFTRPRISLYNVVADGPLQVVRVTRAALARTMAPRSSRGSTHPKHIMAKAHWMRANHKVTETIVSKAPLATKKPRFWNLLDDAVSQRIKLIIKQLSHMSAFQSMSDETMSGIVSSAKYDTVDKGHAIYSHGDAPKRYYVVVSGRVHLYSPLTNFEHIALKRVGAGQSFGEFEILTSQMTRNLSAIAQDTTQLISFTAQTFTDLWDPTTLGHMRHDIAFFQGLDWVTRLELDRVCHLYHAVHETVYTKDAVIFPAHVKLSHVYILKAGVCNLESTLHMEREPVKRRPSEPPVVVHVHLAQVAAGHTVWALGQCAFGLVAASADTKILGISYDLLRSIVPKWAQSDLDRNVAQQEAYHTSQLTLLQQRAAKVLNLRNQVASVDHPQAPTYYLPPLQTHSHTLTPTADGRVNISMTDVVAAHPVDVAALLHERATVASPPPTVPQRSAVLSVSSRLHTLGSFYVGRGTSVLPFTTGLELAAPHVESDTVVYHELAPAPAPVWRRAISPPAAAAAVHTTTSISTKRYDVQAPLRLFRLQPIPIAAQDHTATPSPLASISVLGPGFHMLVNPAPSPQETPSPQTRPEMPREAQPETQPETQLETSQRNESAPKAVVVSAPNPLKLGRASRLRVPAGKITRGKLRLAHRTPWLVTIFQDYVLACYEDEHDIGRVAVGRWMITATTSLVEFPREARSPTEFHLVVHNQTTVFVAATLADKLRWLGVLHESIHELAATASAFRVASNRIESASTTPVAPVVEDPDAALPRLTYVVAFEGT